MPPVRELNALVNEIGQAYQPQYQALDKDIAFNEQSGVAATAGIEAKAQQAWSGIEQSAQNKGMFFSGVPMSERANYNATVYTPELARLNQTIAQTRNQLLGRKAEYDTDIRNKAFATRESDLGALRTWEQQQQQRAWEAQQAELKRQADLRNTQITANASRASSGGSSNVSGVVNAVGGLLSAKKGKDGYVHPSVFQQGKQQWVSAGGDPEAYNQAFSGYINPNHYWEYTGTAKPQR